jgi:hypothetical protein
MVISRPQSTAAPCRSGLFRCQGDRATGGRRRYVSLWLSYALTWSRLHRL